MISIQIGAIIPAVTVVVPRPGLRISFADRFEGAGGRRALWLLGLGMVLFGLAELPALVTMSAHGTGVLGFERAGTTRRLNEILSVWGPHGRGAAEAHVFIDLGFIACYGLLLAGLCVRLRLPYQRSGHPRVARIATAFAWAALIAATVNILQKLILWLELHGQTAQLLPALASLSACHMLWFLDFARRARHRVLSYEDEPEGMLDGSRFTEVVLRPRVVFKNEISEDAIGLLHDQAHEACFIANSVSCAVRVEPRLR